MENWRDKGRNWPSCAMQLGCYLNCNKVPSANTITAVAINNNYSYTVTYMRTLCCGFLLSLLESRDENSDWFQHQWYLIHPGPAIISTWTRKQVVKTVSEVIQKMWEEVKLLISILKHSNQLCIVIPIRITSTMQLYILHFSLMSTLALLNEFHPFFQGLKCWLKMLSCMTRGVLNEFHAPFIQWLKCCYTDHAGVSTWLYLNSSLFWKGHPDTRMYI